MAVTPSDDSNYRGFKLKVVPVVVVPSVRLVILSDAEVTSAANRVLSGNSPTACFAAAMTGRTGVTTGSVRSKTWMLGSVTA